MGMLCRMRGQLRIDHAAEQHQPCCEQSDRQAWNESCHRPLPKGSSLDRFLLMNLRNHVINQLLGQESALDVFPDDTLLVDEHTNGQSEHPELIGDFVVTIHQYRKGMPILLDVLANLGIVFQLVDGEYHESLLPEPVI